ncbi:MAG: elongation factor G [Alphaproteobacteria bacterium]|nr:elongation factor G [Alphaproteobacteria bacterium]
MSERARCAALVGPYLSGKTTLLESMLLATEAISRRGSVKDGTTVGDSADEARARNMSTELTPARLTYLGDAWTVLDCPGSIELMQETQNALHVTDIAVLVMEPSLSRAVTLTPIIQALQARQVPYMVFINKVDNLTESIPDVVAALKEASGTPMLMREYPITDGETVVGYVDLTSRRAYSYVDGKESEEIEFPEALADEVTLAREEMLEVLVDFDDAILEKLLEEEVPEADEVYEKAAKIMRDGDVIPVFFGSAERSHGVRRLLKALRHDAPRPEQRAAKLGFDPNGEAAVQVFKTFHAQHSGKISLARVWSGTVSDGQTLGGARIGSLQTMVGSQADKISKAAFGDIVGLGRMEIVRTGDVLRVGADSADRSDWPEPLAPVYSLAITPENRSDEVKLTGGLQRLNEEDPSLTYEQNEDTHELVLLGQGDIHLQISLDKLRSKYNVTATAARPNVPYKETIRKPVTQHGRFKRQTGGHGMFGDVVVDITPRTRGSGFEFADKIVGGSVPRQYIPAVETGVKEFAVEGPLGFPVVDFAVTLTDGQFHSVDSNEMSFKLAARVAMTEGMPKCGPVLLEPIAKVTIDVPSEYTNKVHGLISVRRGQILGFEPKEGWHGWDSLQAHMPQSELHDLIIELRSLSQGVGTYHAEFDHLNEITGRIADEIVQARAAARKEERER